MEKVSLEKIATGETFKIGDYEFIVLEHLDDTTAVILKDRIVELAQFGENNNYAGSNVDRICIEFGKTVEALVGEGNLTLHVVDLTSDDGLKEYGTVERFMSLITCDMYRRYGEILDKYRLDDYWWLATPFSTPRRGDDFFVKSVESNGCIGLDSARDSEGVRPFCILKSDIILS